MYVSVETTKLHYIFFRVLISKQKRAFILFLAIFLITVTRVRASTSSRKLYFKIPLITLFPTHSKFFTKNLRFIISPLMENVTFKIVSMIVHTMFRQAMFNTMSVHCFLTTRSEKTPRNFRFPNVYEIMYFITSELIASHTLLQKKNSTTS